MSKVSENSGNIVCDDVWRSTTPNLPARGSKPVIKKYMDGSSKILKLLEENSIKFKEQSLEDFIDSGDIYSEKKSKKKSHRRN